MGFRTTPEVIDRLAIGLRGSMERLAKSKPPPEADAGPSSAALTAMVAELVRADAGVVETTARAADDLHANRSNYAGTDDANAGLFQQHSPS